MPTLSMEDKGKSLPPLPGAAKLRNGMNYADNVIEMNSTASKSSISLNTPIKSTPVVSTTPTNVNSLDKFSSRKRSSEDSSARSSGTELGSNLDLNEGGSEKENVCSFVSIEEGVNSEAAVMSSRNKNIADYGDLRTQEIAEDLELNSSVPEIPSSLGLDDTGNVDEAGNELGDGIKFGNENGTEMLSYRRSRGKAKNKLNVETDLGSQANNSSMFHSKNKSLSTPVTTSGLSPSQLSSNPATGNGLTPTVATTPKIEVDYNLYVDEKYLDTQYRYASERRDTEFHQLFTNVPKDDRLLDDFSCALSREILLQGRIYISEHYLCFNSSLLGWVTTMVISLDEIQKFERRSTVGLFPNGIIIETKEARHTFASFITRDQTLNFIETIWSKSISLSKKNHEKSRDFESVESKTSFENMHDKSVKPLSESDLYTIDGDSSSDNYNNTGKTGNTDRSTDDDEYESSVVSENVLEIANNIVSKTVKVESSGAGKKSIENKKNLFPGPRKHSPSKHELDKNKMNGTIVLDKEIDLPLGLLYDIFFGKDITFHKNMMVMNDGLNFTDYSGFEKQGSERKFEYDKKLNYPIGPSSTRVYCTERLEHLDFNDYIEILNISKTPNVPSGSAFDCRTRYMMLWGEENRTRLVISFSLNWTGSSWFKSIIESSALSGQQKAADDVDKELLKLIPSKIIEFGLNEPSEETDVENESNESNVTNLLDKETSGKANMENIETVGTGTSDKRSTSSDTNISGTAMIKTPYGKYPVSYVLMMLLVMTFFVLVMTLKISADNNKLRSELKRQGRLLNVISEKLKSFENLERTLN
ncbi:hypothetical protein PMKS-002555 [Pichia membranifaciens]|uniref:VASt domain-containing protein n=1 Tax=Pichia membranifaciens TaxID=4926 RepID=A0A1Q2YHP7_9ASCO|nr:hypothetical protein PMKS-002555 [Pichia membranifaciens]